MSGALHHAVDALNPIPLDRFHPQGVGPFQFGIQTRPVARGVISTGVLVIPGFTAGDGGRHGVVQLPQEQAQRFTIADPVELVLQGNLNGACGLIRSQQQVLDGIHRHLAVAHHVAIEMETAIGAWIHRGQCSEEGLERLHRLLLLPIRLVCDQFRAGVHEAPGRGADVIGEAHPHLAGLHVMPADVQIQEGDVLTQETGFTPEFLTLPAFLNTVEIVTRQLPGPLQLLFHAKRTGIEGLFSGVAIEIELAGGMAFGEPGIEIGIIGVVPGRDVVLGHD